MRTRSRGGPKQKSQAEPILFEYPADQGVIIFTRHDNRQLGPTQFLNDTLISFFMQFHLDHQVDDSLQQRIHVFNSFFFAKIKSINKHGETKSQGLAHASRWLKSVNIFDKDFLIMPVCDNDHWVLIIVCYPASECHKNYNKIPDEELHEPAVIVLNSCKGMAPAIKKLLGQFLKYQWSLERSSERNFSINDAKKNGIRLIFPDLPQQRNNYDCGVYILCYFYCFLKDPRSMYIKMFRRRNLKSWFTDNKIDISRERRKMRTIIDGQITAWRKTRVTELDSGINSQEIHIGSPSSSNIDMEEEGIGQNGSVIVIH